MSFKMLLVLPFFCIGCIHQPEAQLRLSADLPPPPPPPTTVAACEKTLTWHNVWVLSGTLFGGLAGAGGGADALDSNTNVQKGIGAGVLASGIFAAVSATAAGITENTYATDGCAQILQAAANAGTL